MGPGGSPRKLVVGSGLVVVRERRAFSEKSPCWEPLLAFEAAFAPQHSRIRVVARSTRERSAGIAFGYLLPAIHSCKGLLIMVG